MSRSVEQPWTQRGARNKGSAPIRVAGNAPVAMVPVGGSNWRRAVFVHNASPVGGTALRVRIVMDSEVASMTAGSMTADDEKDYLISAGATMEVPWGENSTPYAISDSTSAACPFVAYAVA